MKLDDTKDRALYRYQAQGSAVGYEVFVSYARSSAGVQARMLADELILRGHNAFLDTRDIPPGAPFPEELAAAVHNAGVVVIFADASYFSREWCLREFDSAVAVAGPRVVVALPTEGVPDAVILPLPPSVARGSWPTADQTATLASLVEGLLAGERSRDLAVPGASPLLPDGITRPSLFRGDQPVVLEGAAETLDNRFIGRAQAMWQVFHALETRRFGGAPRVVLVSGGGGSGKSQLAAEYVRRVGPRYYHAVFWTSADAPLAAHQQSLRAILAALGIANADQARLEALIGSRLVALAREGKRVLWVVDNVPEASAGQPAPPLSTWCPATKYVSLLATSRRHQLFGAHETISLGPLDVSAGIELLTTPDVDARWLGEDDWREIVRWVGSLPLALRILQAGLSDGTLAAQALLERTRREEPALALDDELGALNETLPPDALRGVASAFGASLEALQADPSALLALARFAILPPWPVPDAVARRLADDKTVAALARRGWLQPAAGAKGERQWRLHRIAASFVRLQSEPSDALQGVLHAMESILSEGATPAADDMRLGLILGGLTERIRPLVQQPGNRALVDTAERVMLAAVSFRLDDPAWRGVRVAGAKWAGVLVAWDLLVRFAKDVVQRGNPRELASLPHALQPVGRIPQIATIMANLFDQASNEVRGQALVHASSYAPGQMFPKLVRVAQSDPSPQIRQRASLAFQPWISEGGEGMRLVAAYCTAELKSAPAAVTPLALQLAGEIIAFCRDTDPQTVAGLVPQLEVLATADDTSDQAHANALAAAHALGQHTDIISFDALSKALAAAPDVPDDPVRLLAIDVLGEYLRTIDAPRRPTDIRFEYDDDGGLVVRGRVPPTVHRPELSGALIDLVTRGAGPAAQHALSALLTYTAGDTVLKSAIQGLFDADDAARILWIADSWIAVNQNKEVQYRAPEPHWWRGMIREQQGDAASALSEYVQVTQLAPQFGYAFKRIARIEAQLGDAAKARVAFAAAQRLIADDPELEVIAKEIASASPTVPEVKAKT